MTPNNFQEHKTIKKWLKKQKRAWYGLNNAILQYIHPKNVHKEPKICAIVSHELYTKLLFISSVVSYLYKCNAQNAQFGSAQSCNFKRIGSLWNKTSKLSSNQKQLLSLTFLVSWIFFQGFIWVFLSVAAMSDCWWELQRVPALCSF